RAAAAPGRGADHGSGRRALHVVADDPAGGEQPSILGPTAAPGEADRVRLPRLTRHTIALDDGQRVAVAVCGTGVPLVLVHGFSAEGMLYAQSLWRLVDMGFKVVAIDVAGHGGTQGL